MPISVLSYNVWGIFTSNDLARRTRLIAERLAPYDIVCMQEQFNEADADVLWQGGRGGGAGGRAAPAPSHPFRERFDSSLIGSGLTIFSRFPIVAKSFVPFRCGGAPWKVWEGDAIANKGFAIVKVRVPLDELRTTHSSNAAAAVNIANIRPPVVPLTEGPSGAATGERGEGRHNVSSAAAASAASYVDVTVVNTHLVAQYEKYSQIGGYFAESNSAVRLAQVIQLGQLLVTLAMPTTTMSSSSGGVPPSPPVLLCGDLNFGPFSPEMFTLKSILNSQRISTTSAIQRADVYSYSPENDYNSPKGSSYLACMNMQEDSPVCLDHVMLVGNGLVIADAEGCGRLVFNERVVERRDGSAAAPPLDSNSGVVAAADENDATPLSAAASRRPSTAHSAQGAATSCGGLPPVFPSDHFGLTCSVALGSPTGGPRLNTLVGDNAGNSADAATTTGGGGGDRGVKALGLLRDHLRTQARKTTRSAARLKMAAVASLVVPLLVTISVVALQNTVGPSRLNQLTTSTVKPPAQAETVAADTAASVGLLLSGLLGGLACASCLFFSVNRSAEAANMNDLAAVLDLPAAGAGGDDEGVSADVITRSGESLMQPRVNPRGVSLPEVPGISIT